MKEYEFEYLDQQLSTLQMAIESIAIAVGSQVTPLSNLAGDIGTRLNSDLAHGRNQLTRQRLKEDRYVDGSVIVSEYWLETDCALLKNYLHNSVIPYGGRLGGVTMEEIKKCSEFYERRGGNYGSDVVKLRTTNATVWINKSNHSFYYNTTIDVRDNKLRFVGNAICVTEQELLEAITHLYETLGLSLPVHRSTEEIELMIAESALVEQRVLTGQFGTITFELGNGWAANYFVASGRLEVRNGRNEIMHPNNSPTCDSDYIYRRISDYLAEEPAVEGA